MVDSAQLLDPQQERIVRHLHNLVGPGPADFFRDACQMMSHRDRYQSTTHIVAHLLRECESALRAVLSTILTDHPIDEQKCECCGQVLKKGCSKGQTIDQIAHTLFADNNGEAEAIAKIWKKIVSKEGYRLVHRHALSTPREVDNVEFVTYWDEVNEILDKVLDRFQAQFSRVFRYLDVIMETGPLAAKRLKQNVPNNLVAFRYFFDKLNDPNWLQPLSKEGLLAFFPVYADTEGTTRYPDWPQGKYLARMARISDAQQSVVDIVMNLPATDSPYVSEHLLDIALALPPKSAGKIADRAITPATRPGSFLTKKLSQVICHVANGAVKCALRITRSTLQGFLKEDDPSQQSDPSSLWECQKLIAEVLPLLIRLDWIATVDTLIGLLDEAIRHAIEPESTQGCQDHSQLWCPRIGDSRFYSEDTRKVLVQAVIDSARLLSKQGDPAALEEFLQTVESQRWLVFKRIALHILEHFGSSLSCGERLASRKYFDDQGLQTEYRSLLQSRFGELAADRQRLILGWIAEDPVSDTVSLADRKLWQRDYLSCCKPLPPKWRKQYDALVAELGPPQSDHMSSTVWVGPTSPIQLDSIRKMSVRELVDYLKSWKPTRGWRNPTPEGLGRKIEQIVSDQPQRFAEEAKAFIGVKPLYIGYFFEGLSTALRSNHEFDWDKVLDLMDWVISESQALLDASEVANDCSWGWPRKAIARLLSVSLDPEKPAIDLQYRSAVWSVLEPLTHDPDPEPEESCAKEGRPDPFTASIQTIRGNALHAVVRYAYWAAKGRPGTQGTNDVDGVVGLAAVPEAQSVLERHLDPDYEQSAAIWAVYGSYVNLLVHLDRDWLICQRPHIFPHAPELNHLRKAAWHSYLLYYSPTVAVFKALESEYEYGVNELPGTVATESSAAERLGEHLVWLYSCGHLELQGLLSLFEEANCSLRTHCIRFIGRMLTERPTPDALVRLKVLWTNRRDSMDCTRCREEPAAFGWWVTSNVFEESWVLEQLEAILALVPIVDRDSEVVDYLSKVADEGLAAAVRCLKSLVQHADGTVKVYGWRQALKRALERALKSTEAELSRTGAK